MVVATELDSADVDDNVVPAPRLLALAPPPVTVAAFMLLLPALTEGETSGLVVVRLLLLLLTVSLEVTVGAAASADFPLLSLSFSLMTWDCRRSYRLLGRRSN